MVDRVSTARAEGDLRENFAYHDGRRDLGFLDGRIQTIEGILANAVVIEASTTAGRVGLGSTVVVKDEFGESTYSLVGPTEADVKRGLISMESPLGSALLGAEPGQDVTFVTPSGSRVVKVVGVS
jgi:transcription elongation factor GreA